MKRQQDRRWAGTRVGLYEAVDMILRKQHVYMNRALQVLEEDGHGLNHLRGCTSCFSLLLYNTGMYVLISTWRSLGEQKLCYLPILTGRQQFCLGVKNNPHKGRPPQAFTHPINHPNPHLFVPNYGSSSTDTYRQQTAPFFLNTTVL